jgi:hypothetical protein
VAGNVFLSGAPQISLRDVLGDATENALTQRGAQEPQIAFVLRKIFSLK